MILIKVGTFKIGLVVDVTCHWSGEYSID